MSKFGCLQFGRRNGKPPLEYCLKVGPNRIGTSLTADIRFKISDRSCDPVLCIIHVRDDGLATVENTCKLPVSVNGSRVGKVQVLRHQDRLLVADKEFQYMNQDLPTDVTRPVQVERRQSAIPKFTTATVSKIPVSVSKLKRRSLSAVKISQEKEVSRRSCSSALPYRKRKTRHYDWETIATPGNNRKLLRPSTSMYRPEDLSISVRKSLFLKNKDLSTWDTSRNKSLSLLEDSILTSESRGLKRTRSSSSDSLNLFNSKRPKRSERLLFLSISGCESLFQDSESSLGEQDSPLASALYEMLNSSPRSPRNDTREVKEFMTKTPKEVKSPKNNITELREVKQSKKKPKEVKSPKNDLSNIRGVKQLMKTPKEVKPPKNDLSDVRGLKKLMKTPREQKSPQNDLTNVGGVKQLMKTPKIQKSPLNDLTNLRGVKKFLRTPKEQKSPLNDLTNVRGVRKLMKTPKPQRSPRNDLTDVRGVKKFLRTPKEQKSPLNDLSNVGGVKKLMRTPKEVKSPKNNLTDVRGVKQLMKTPLKKMKSPKNDLSDVWGLKKLMKTPKEPKSPLNDLTTNISGVWELMETLEEVPPILNKSPTKMAKIQLSPLKNDVRVQRLQTSPGDVRGVRKILQSPKHQLSPVNDLDDVHKLPEVDTISEEVVHQVLVSTPTNLPVVGEEVQLSQRGRRIRRKQLGDDFVGSPIADAVRTRRARKQQQESVTPLSTPNLEKDSVVQVKMIRNVRGRVKEVVPMVEEEEVGELKVVGGSPNVETETVEVQRRGGRGRRKKDTNDVRLDTVSEEKVKKSTKRRKNDEEEEESEVRSMRRRRGGKVEEEVTVVVEKINTRRGRLRKTDNLNAEDNTKQGPGVKLEEEKSEESCLGGKKNTRRGRRGKMEEEINEEISVVEKVSTRRGPRGRMEEENCESTVEEIKTSTRRGRKAATEKENDGVVEKKPTRRGRGGKIEEENIEDSPVVEKMQTRRGRGNGKIEEKKVEEDAYSVQQNGRPLRSRRLKIAEVPKEEVVEVTEDSEEQVPRTRRRRLK